MNTKLVYLIMSLAKSSILRWIIVFVLVLSKQTPKRELQRWRKSKQPFECVIEK